VKLWIIVKLLYREI